MRRFFWSAIHVADEPLEYSGRGVELFIGFLIVIAILSPLTVAWRVLHTLIEIDSVGVVVGQFLYFFLLSALVTAAGFRARRYRLSRTLWRGIRAGQDGATWEYTALTLMWGLISGITLGLATPWMRTVLQRYLIEYSFLGNARFSFDAHALPLLKSWLPFNLFAALATFCHSSGGGLLHKLHCVIRIRSRKGKFPCH